MTCLSSFMKAETVRILARLLPAPQSRAPVHSLLRTAAQENLPLILHWLHLRCVFFPFRCFSLLLLVAIFPWYLTVDWSFASGKWNTCAWGLSLRSICAALFNLGCWTLIYSIPQRCLIREARLNCTSAGPYGHESRFLLWLAGALCCNSFYLVRGVTFSFINWLFAVVCWSSSALAIAEGWVLDLLSELTCLQWCFCSSTEKHLRKL